MIGHPRIQTGHELLMLGVPSEVMRHHILLEIESH